MARDLPLGTSVFTGSPATNRNPGSFEARAAELARRRRYAELLQAQALKEGDGAQMVSGHYIANPWNALGKVLSGAMSGYQQSQADKDERALASEREAAFKAGLDNMPTSRVVTERPAGSPDYQMEPDIQRTVNPTAQDWMRWGGEMSQNGPMGQAIGQAAVTQGLTSLFKTPAVPDYEKIELPVGNGMIQLAYIDKRNPTAPPIPVGQPMKDEKKPSALDQRVNYSAELAQLQTIPEAQRTPAQQERMHALNTALSQYVVVPDGQGGIFTGPKSGMNAPTAGAASAPSVNGQPSVPGLGKVDPGTQAARDGQRLGLLKTELAAAVPGSPEHTALTTEIRTTEEKIRANEAKAAEAEGTDPYAPYRSDPRNAQYIPKPTPAGMKQVSQGTGSSAKLNVDVQALSKRVVDEKIPEFESAWESFDKAINAARADRGAEMEKLSKRNMWEKAMDAVQFGGGVGGPLGIYNTLPTFMTSEKGRDVRVAVGLLKAFQRHALFGATLTNNEKTSFEEVAGTLFGMDTENFNKAMANMRAQFEKKKQELYDGFAPIVVDSYRKEFGGKKAPTQTAQPWLGGGRF